MARRGDVQVPAASSIEDIGARLRELRRGRGYSLEALREASGLSLGLLSQLERGKANPSFTTMVQLAQALDVTLSDLVAHQDPSPVVARAERPTLGSHRGFTDTEGVSAQLLTPGGEHPFEVTSLVMDPGYSTEGRPFQHEGEEFGLILAGRHEVFLAGERHVLEEGDSITFDARVPHWYRNPGPDPVEALWVVSL